MIIIFLFPLARGERAIKSLTTDRHTSTLASKNHVEKVKQKLISKGGYDEIHAKRLTDKTISQWEYFYESIVQNKQPNNLKIAYLSGANPINDLTEMVSLGVLPENIWAFESDKSVYDDAVISALASEFPFIKIVKSKIGDFFSISPQKFDIIYLDFCGPLPSRNKKQKTLNTIIQILSHHTLNSPGELITNVSLPTEKMDKEGLGLIKLLVAIYLYPKNYIDDEVSNGAEAEGYSIDEWIDLVSNNIEHYYSQFVTRFIIDIIGVLVPYDRFLTKNILLDIMFTTKDSKLLKESINKFLHETDLETDYPEGYLEELENYKDNPKKHSSEFGDMFIDTTELHEKYFNPKNKQDIIYSITSDINMYPSLWSLVSLSKKLNKKDGAYSQEIFSNEKFHNFSASMLSQLSLNNNADQLIENIAKMTYLLSEGYCSDKFNSSSMERLEKHNFKEVYPHFCDVMLFHQIKEVLFRQLAVPYHVNIDATKRWKYKAKKTPMYMDLFIVDECRYLYDWMPTIDMINTSLGDIERQLSFRFVLDAIGKHRLHYNTEFFFGTACVGSNHDGFEAKYLSEREVIN